MSNPYASPESAKPFASNPEVRRVAVRPFDRLGKAYRWLGNEYWLFVGICFVGMFIGSLFAILLMGPMVCGIYLCFKQHETRPPTQFDQLFQGFNMFLETFLATLIMTGVTLLVLLPFYCFMFAGFFGIMGAVGDPDDAGVFFLPMIGLFYMLIIVLMLAVSVPFTFVFPLIADRGLKAIDAIKLSWAGAKANFWGIVGMYFAHALLGLLSLCFCYIPVLFLMPLALGSVWLLYREVYPVIRHSAKPEWS